MSMNIMNALVANVGKFDAKLSAEQIGKYTLDLWVSHCYEVKCALYQCVADAQNGVFSMNSNADLSDLFSALRGISAMIGDVNGAKLRFNKDTAMEIAMAISTYATADKKKKSADLQFAEERKRNAETLLRKYAKLNGVQEKALQEQYAIIAECKLTIAALKDTDGECVRRLGMTSDNAFRVAFEQFIARQITIQCARSAAEIEAEEYALKQARAAKRKANKKSK